MSKPLAIKLENVSKVYKLHGSQKDQLIDVFGLNRIGIKFKTKPKKFIALDNINLEVPKGQRIGIVGRNGAGKSTLLKLLCGNFAPTHGNVEVNGEVQALMNIGLGFHPDYTGRENVEASLQYNGLNKSEYKDALKDIMDFCELGDFFNQPFKTYSLGMQTRLMFASATAIRPDILIIDEVLGSGDAYFVAKSKSRVNKMISSGCTMLLVSHSMQQVLELCDQAIWMDKGSIKMQGDTFEVIKAYEEYMYGSTRYLKNNLTVATQKNTYHSIVVNEDTLNLSYKKALTRSIKLPNEIFLNEPRFQPHAETPLFPIVCRNNQFDFISPGGISRWEAIFGLKVSGFTIVTEKGLTNKLVALRPAKIIISLVAEIKGSYNCRYCIAIDDYRGTEVVKIFSPIDDFVIKKSEHREIEIILNPIQIGPGDYTIGLSILDGTPLEQINNASRYDLLSRSFSVSVEVPDSLSILTGKFIHSAEWIFNPSIKPKVSNNYDKKEVNNQ